MLGAAIVLLVLVFAAGGAVGRPLLFFLRRVRPHSRQLIIDIQIAAGERLDQYGEHFGVHRYVESDEEFRDRIQVVLRKKVFPDSLRRVALCRVCGRRCDVCHEAMRPASVR